MTFHNRFADMSFYDVMTTWDYDAYVPKEHRDFIVPDDLTDESQKFADDETDFLHSMVWGDVAALG